MQVQGRGDCASSRQGRAVCILALAGLGCSGLADSGALAPSMPIELLMALL